MIIEKIIYPSVNEPYNREIIAQISNGIETICGTVFLKKGTRIPEVGFSRHPFNEVSIVTKGCIELIDESGAVIGYLNTGMAVFIKANEPQAGNVLEDTEIIYVLNQAKNNGK